MRRKLLLAGTVIVGICVVVFLLRSTVFLDPDYQLNLLFSGRLDWSAVNAELVERHRGPTPCLRYTTDIPEEEVSAAAAQLLAAGFSDQELGGLTAQFLDWNEKKDATSHALSRREEKEEVTFRHLGLADRLIHLLNQRRFREQEDRAMAGHWARADAVLSALSPEKKQSLRQLWEAHPRAYTLHGQLQLLGEMRRQISLAREPVPASPARA